MEFNHTIIYDCYLNMQFENEVKNNYKNVLKTLPNFASVYEFAPFQCHLSSNSGFKTNPETEEVYGTLARSLERVILASPAAGQLATAPSPFH